MPTIDAASSFLNAEDVGKGLIVKFHDAGQFTEKEFDGKKKRRLELTVELPSGEKKTWAPNWTTQEEIAKGYGRATEQWVGKEARLWTAKQAVSGKMMLVVYGEAHQVEEEVVE